MVTKKTTSKAVKKATTKKEAKAEGAETEETKEEEFDWDAEYKKDAFERRVKKLIKVVVGLLFLTGGVWLTAIFWQNFVGLFKEWIGPVVILLGLFVLLFAALD